MSQPAHRFTMAIVLALAAPVSAGAQVPFESQGTRALGMAGAFVAVADDATATYWNPAGLPHIRFFDATLERTGVDHEELTSDLSRAGTGWRSQGTRLAIALPVLGFSYDRSEMFEVRPSATGAVGPDRQDLRTEAVARSFRVQHFGLTLVQSAGDFIVVGSTLRLVRGGASATRLEEGAPVDEGIRRAEAMEAGASSRFDADIGALAWIGRLRLGLVVRNLMAPEFGVSGGEPWRVPRQARMGISLGGEPARGQRPWVVAVDADLTATSLPEGDRRSLAAGAERWWLDRRVALRGGARVQTVDDLRPAASAGMSVGVRAGMLIEAQATGGVDTSDRGWSVAARVTF